MKILSIVSHKGGAGKTTTAVLLAEELARRGFRVLLVDADRQRSAGLLLGIDNPTGTVQQTQHPRLRYYCSAGVPIRDVPAKVEELVGLFDLAVADTPSLDDPLARVWLQQSHAALMVVPVDPLSLKTLEGAENTLAALHTLNRQINFLGMLPTMFDERASSAQSLLMELVARRPGGVLTPAIPLDEGLVHRASPTAERRTQPSEATRAAHGLVTARVVGEMGLEEIYQGEAAPAAVGKSRWTPDAQRAMVSAAPAGSPLSQPAPAAQSAWSSQPAPPQPTAAAPVQPVMQPAAQGAPFPVPPRKSIGPLKWAALGGAVVALAISVLAATMRRDATPEPAAGGAALVGASAPANSKPGKPVKSQKKPTSAVKSEKP